MKTLDNLLIEAQAANDRFIALFDRSSRIERDSIMSKASKEHFVDATIRALQSAGREYRRMKAAYDERRKVQ